MAAYEVLLLNTAVPQIQAAQSGDTYVVPRDIAFSAALTLSAGTANGVPYLNGSKVLTTGSALTFDGTNLYMGSTIGAKLALYQSGGSNIYGFGVESGAVTFLTSSTEQMRLTSTGLGIGTSSPLSKLTVAANMASAGSEQLYITGTSNTQQLRIGYNTTGNYGVIQPVLIGTGYKDLVINPDGGNLGLGVTPSAWGSGRRSLDVSNASFYSQTGNYNGVASNAYNNGSNWIYKTTAAAQLYEQGGGLHSWFTAPSGTAGNAITFTQALTLDANRNLLLNGTSAGASAVGTFAIFNGTAPTGSVTNGIILYAEDVSSSSELKVRDEAGNVTTLSPHNFSLIPEGPSEDMAWAYYSEKGGKRINVDMLKLARMVEKLTGEKLVYEA